MRIKIVRLLLMCLFGCILLLVSSTLKSTDADITQPLILKLSEAENYASIKKIENLFTEDAILLNEEGPPIVGEKAILAFYNYIFQRFEIESSYQVIQTDFFDNTAHLKGKYAYKSIHKQTHKVDENVSSFKLMLIRVDNEWKVSQLIYGTNIDPYQRVPSLPKPSGNYAVGMKDFYYIDPDRQETLFPGSSKNRQVAFQLWYPAKDTIGKNPRPYQNLKTATAAAKFLGWPLFNNYSVLVQSNSYSEVEAIKSNPFPLILYNHGYGGFTTVHQTIIEELTSHGFVVASVGHAYESALFIMPDGGVLPFDKNNPAFQNRLVEANGVDQERYKDQIIHADRFSIWQESYKRLLLSSPLHQESVNAWAEDNRFVLKKLKEINAFDPMLKGIIDLQNVGVIGHSLGGATAGEMSYQDKQIKAGVNLDGFQFGNLINNRLEIPFLFVWENGINSDNIKNANKWFCKTSNKDCYSLLIKNFEHSYFTDLPIFKNIGLSPKISPQLLKIVELQRDYIRTFFNRYLKNSPEPKLEEVEKQYPETILNKVH